MIIAIDGSEANEIKRVGSSEYAIQLLNALYRISSHGKSAHTFLIFLKQSHINDLPEENEKWRYEIMPSTRLWMFKKIIPRLLFGSKVDIFFSPTHYLPIIANISQVCTIHDLGYLIYSEQFNKYDFWQLKCWTAISIIISKYIIAVSNSTKNDIVRHYPFAYKKVKTIYHGVDHRMFNSNIPINLVRHVKNKYKIRKNYILSIGTLKPSKNIEGIINSFSDFISNNEDISQDYQLVIAGKKGWMYERIFQLIESSKIKDKVIFTDYVSSEDKRTLYKGAKLLISPSFWEGFGMHVLESMACGTPVVISKEGSLEEIAGNAGMYVDPNSYKSISKGMQNVVRLSKSEYNTLSDRCMRRAADFSWDKTAQSTLEIFNQIKVS